MLRDLCREYLVKHVETVLESQDADGVFWGDFGFPTDLPTVYHQYAHYPLAVLFCDKAESNPYRGDPRLLDAVTRSLDATCRAVHPDGTFICTSRGFDWGTSPDEWRTYFWMRSVELLTNPANGGSLLSTELSDRCAEGVERALQTVFRQVEKVAGNPDFPHGGEVANHFCWYVLTVYRAGQIYGRNDWQELAADVFRRIVAVQQPDGYWLEGGGFTTLYNFVSLMAVSLYHEFSGDAGALDATNRALEMHKHLTYPDARLVEVADGRVRYHPRSLPILPPSWSRSPQGTAYLSQMVEGLLDDSFGEGHQGYAFFTEVYRHITPDTAAEPLRHDRRYQLGDGKCVVRRNGKWLIALSALTRPPMPENRWQLDRQNHISLWHRAAGHIAGGGGSKDQPEYSTFSVAREGSLFYLATSGSLESADEVERLSLDYDGFRCYAAVTVADDDQLVIEAGYEGVAPGEVIFRLALETSPGDVLHAAGAAHELSETELKLPADGASCRGWKLETPSAAVLTWPVCPFNSYRQDNQATLESAYTVLSCPVGAEPIRICIKVETVNADDEKRQ